MQDQSVVELSGDLSGSRDSAGVPSGSLQGRWLHIPVEIKAREFDPKLLLACCAAERGATALIGEFGIFNKYSDVMPAGIMYEKDVSPRKQKILETYQKNGHRIVANDDESLAVYEWPEMFHYDRICDKAANLTDMYFAWGDIQAEAIKQLVPSLGEKIRPLGTPRTDVQRPPLSGLYDEAAAAFRKRFGPFILFPSNFGSLVTVPKGRAVRIRKWNNFGRPLDEKKLEWVLARADHMALAVPKMIEALKSLRETFPQHALVVRPHPTDGDLFWREAVAGIDNCHVVYEDVSLPWIMAADAMFHFGCGTAVEAYVLGRKAVTYTPLRDDRFDQTFEAALPPIAHDVETLVALIGDIIHGRAVEQADQAWFDCHLHLASSLASDLIVDELDSYDWGLRSQQASRSVLKQRLLERRIRQSLKVRWRRFVKAGRLTPAKVDVRNRSAPVWPDTDLGEVERKLVFFQLALRRFQSLHVEKISRNLFLIASDGSK